MQVQPYLFFDGRCEQAIEFYRRALGAEVTMLMRFKDSPEPHQPGMIPSGAEDKVMHASFRIGDSTVMASDGRCQGRPSFQGFSLSLTVPDDAEAERLFATLREPVITCVVDALRDLVFKRWTAPERLMRWWASRGFERVRGT